MTISAVVGFSKPKSRWAVLGQLIRLVEGTPFSHAYIRRVIDGETIIFEARGLDVHAQSTASWPEQPVFEFQVDLSPASWSYLVSQLERSYSRLEFVGLGLMRLFRLRSNPLAGAGNVCSTLVAHVLELPNPDECDPRRAWSEVQLKYGVTTK